MNRNRIEHQELLTLHEAPILAPRERVPNLEPQIEVRRGTSQLLRQLESY